MPARLLATAALSAAAFVALCAHSAEAAQELVASTAASLAPAMQALAAEYAVARPGVKVLVNSGASGALLQQIRAGAPADLFVSADEATMDQAQAQQLVDAATRADIASNTLVVVVPAGAANAPRTLAELALPAVQRIAIGNPATVPAGRYAREALAATAFAVLLEPKFLPADNVRQALAYVARGEAEAGFVYRTDAQAEAARVRVAFAVATPTPVRYPVAVVKSSPQGAAARDFTSWLRSEPAQAVLGRFGFGKP